MPEQFMKINGLSLYDTDAFFALQLFMTFAINYWIFKRMTGIKTSWSIFLTLALTSLAIQYHLPSLTTVFDVLLLMILAIKAKGKKWLRTEYGFYTLFPVVTSDLLYRLLGLYLLPLLFYQSVDAIGANAFSYLLVYGLLLPIYLVFDRYLGLDVMRWKSFREDKWGQLKVTKGAVISMLVYLFLIYLLVNLEFWTEWSEDLLLRLRMLWVLVYAVYFVLMIARLNQGARQYLEERLVREREQHLKSLTVANQKIESLYQELYQFRQSYQQLVSQLSSDKDQPEVSLAEQVYQNVLRESAKEFERFRGTEANELDNIHSLPLRSLLSARIMEARRAAISVTVAVSEPLSHFEMNVVDLALLLSIFMSNAIDESKQVLSGQIHLGLVQEEAGACYRLTIENTTQEERVDLDDILQEEKQKKASGLNLHTVRDILRKYPEASLVTSSGHYRFKQVLVFR